MTKYTVAFRVDASNSIGTGHVMRCLTLADALRKRGGTCLFLSRAHPGSNLAMILERGHSLVSLQESAAPEEIGLTPPDYTLAHAAWLGRDWHRDAQETAEALAGTQLDMLVVDHYALDWQWERRLRGFTSRIVVIDDLADRLHDCDALLDQNLGRSVSDYSGKAPSECRLLIGPDYALLRPQFAQLRAASLMRNRHPVREVLVSLGGMDQENLTGRILDAIAAVEFATPFHTTVVMGAQSPVLSEVRTKARDLDLCITVLAGVSNMAQLMAESDLGIGAAGATTWERCCMGLPAITVVAAQNQQAVAQALAAVKGTIVLDRACAQQQISRTIENFLTDAQLRADIASKVSKLVDGLGAERVTDALVECVGK